MTQLDPDYELAKELHQYILTKMDERLEGRQNQLENAIRIMTLLVMMMGRGMQLLVSDKDDFERDRVINHLIDNLKIIQKESD